MNGLRLACVVALAGISAAGFAATPRQPSSAIRQEAHRILRNLRSSEYSHTTKIDELTGRYAVDCSGLVTAVLRKAAPRHLAAIALPKGRRRPRAVEFYNAFISAPADKDAKGRWRRIDRLQDVRPGDLIAWRRQVVETGKSTGHILIVDEAPIDEGNGVFRITIIDSTVGPHADDTRKPPAGGVGRGTMWFKADAEGRPTGYRWKAAKGAFRKAPLAIGRAS